MPGHSLVTALDRLRQSEERYREIFEQGLTAIFVADAAGDVLTCNPAFVHIFGHSSLDEALSANLSNFYPHPDEYQNVIQQLTRERSLEYHEACMRRRDGRRSISLASCTVPLMSREP